MQTAENPSQANDAKGFVTHELLIFTGIVLVFLIMTAHIAQYSVSSQVTPIDRG